MAFRRLLSTSAGLSRSEPAYLRANLSVFAQGRGLRASSLRCLSSATRAAIDEAVGSKPVVLFMKGTPETPQCGFSRASIQILGREGVDPNKFSAFNVLEDDDLRQGIKEYSEWPTIPQLYVGKEFVGGCDILLSMHQNGDLSKLFERNGVLVEDQTREASE